VIEQDASRVVGQFHAWGDDPSLKARWPADFRLTADYRLTGNTLRMEFAIENPCDVPLPFGFGTHAYFRVPLGGRSADDCIVRLPVSARWELDQMLPTGRRVELAAAERFDIGRRLGDLKLDDAFTGLASKDGIGEASIDDPFGATLQIRWPAVDFRECVVYTPPHREAICIEPYTCVAGAFAPHMQALDSGIRVIPPGASLRAAVSYALSH
jgi:aldose 1-epimerase